MDQEAIYRLVYEQQWGALLTVMHQHHEAIAGDVLLARAVETFVATFFAQLPDADNSTVAEALEKLFLLHTGGFYTLPDHHFERVVATLVTLHADRSEAALGYARFYPENAVCAAMLRQYAPPESVPHTQDATLNLAVSAPLTEVDATISLFKSHQEIEFFLAVREVYATYFVYPNVALSCLVDYDQIKEHLSTAARHYFFRALVDCVVFDQHDGYRPLYFFELDSPLHDTKERQVKDRHKERILALAGQRLHRLRKHDATSGRTAFVTLLKELAEKG